MKEGSEGQKRACWTRSWGCSKMRPLLKKAFLFRGVFKCEVRHLLDWGTETLRRHVYNDMMRRNVSAGEQGGLIACVQHSQSLQSSEMCEGRLRFVIPEVQEILAV